MSKHFLYFSKNSESFFFNFTKVIDYISWGLNYKTFYHNKLMFLHWQAQMEQNYRIIFLRLEKTLAYKIIVLIMRLCHPPDGSTSPKYKLLCFITTNLFCKEKNTLAFHRDRCCHLVLCLWLIPFHFSQKKSFWY